MAPRNELAEIENIASATSVPSSQSYIKENASASANALEHPGILKPGITFAVDSVTSANRPLWSETLAESLAHRFQRRVLILPQEQEHVINVHLDSCSLEQRAAIRSHGSSFAGSRCHPFVDAVHVAFSQHRPLAISPDAIWLVIAQGFSHHVAENAESMRRLLVRHEGRKHLIVGASSLSLSDFEKAIADFSSLMQQEIDPVLHETLICDFSTTSPAIRTASEVVLMDSFSSYFTYMMMCVCGIPKITIEGTLMDWQRIRARVEVLATYGLEWWVSRLRPILDEFIRAVQGHPTENFWKAIYKPRNAYGGKVATGWITDLFPYLGDAPRRRKNHVFEQDRQNWALPVDHGVETESFTPVVPNGIGLKSFPSGLSSALLKVSFPNESCEEVDLVAGFFAVRQDSFDFTLSPLISWCVAELSPGKPIFTD